MKIDQFGSLDNQNSDYEVGLSGLSTAQNIDITRSHRLTRRKGYIKKLDSPIVAMACAHDTVLFVANNTLMRLSEDLVSSDVIASDLGDSQILTACYALNKIYWSNNKQNGILKNNADSSITMGIPIPPAPVVIEQNTGLMPKGDYICAYTYITTEGEGVASNITVIRDAEFGLKFSNLASPLDRDDVTHIVIYLTQKNGEVLYRVTASPISNNSYIYFNNTSELKFQLRTQYLANLPTGHFIQYFRGRLLIAKNNILFYSEPYNIGLYNPLANFVAFESRITNLGIVRNGVFVTTSTETIFLSGHDPAKWDYVEVAKYGAIENTIGAIDGELVGAEGISNNTQVLYWATKNGFMVGMDDGSIMNLTAKYFHFNSDSKKGTSVLRQENGQDHIITITN